jgi:hypothetical protein
MDHRLNTEEEPRFIIAGTKTPSVSKAKLKKQVSIHRVKKQNKVKHWQKSAEFTMYANIGDFNSAHQHKPYKPNFNSTRMSIKDGPVEGRMTDSKLTKHAELILKSKTGAKYEKDFLKPSVLREINNSENNKLTTLASLNKTAENTRFISPKQIEHLIKSKVKGYANFLMKGETA